MSKVFPITDTNHPALSEKESSSLTCLLSPLELSRILDKICDWIESGLLRGEERKVLMVSHIDP